MYDLGAFPAIVDGEGFIQGEMYKVSIEAFKGLDRLEGYPHHYNRKLVKSTTGEEAWIYFYKTAPYGRKKVESGIWEQPVYTYSYKQTTAIPKAPKRIRTRKDYEAQVKAVVNYDPGYSSMNKEEKQAHFELCIELAMLEEDDRFGKASSKFQEYFGHTYYGKYGNGEKTSSTWIPTPKSQRLEWLTQQYSKLEIPEVPKLETLAKQQRASTINEQISEENQKVWEEAEERCKHLTGNDYTQKLFDAYDDIWEEKIKKEKEKAKESTIKPDSQEDIWENAEKTVLERWIANKKAVDSKSVQNNSAYWDDVSKLVIELESAEYIDSIANIEVEPEFDDPFYFSE